MQTICGYPKKILQSKHLPERLSRGIVLTMQHSIPVILDFRKANKQYRPNAGWAFFPLYIDNCEK